MSEKLTGNTASYWYSAWSGLRIKLVDEETVLVQYFGPQDGEIVYEKPQERKIGYYMYDNDEELIEDGPAPGFVWSQGSSQDKYMLSDFIRYNYMEEINQVLGGNENE